MNRIALQSLCIRECGKKGEWWPYLMFIESMKLNGGEKSTINSYHTYPIIPSYSLCTTTLPSYFFYTSVKLIKTITNQLPPSTTHLLLPYCSYSHTCTNNRPSFPTDKICWWTPNQPLLDEATSTPDTAFLGIVSAAPDDDDEYSYEICMKIWHENMTWKYDMKT